MAADGQSPLYGPGGGGGGGSVGNNGGNGYAGQVELQFTAAGAPTVNILRFLANFPSGGDTNNCVLMIMDTTGTITQCALTYTTASSGTLVMTMYDSSSTLQATSAALTGVNGSQWMLSMELTEVSGNVEYAFRYLDVTAGGTHGSLTGTANTGGIVGAVSDYHTASTLAENAPSGLTGTSVGHIVVQYAYEPLSDVYNAIIGYQGEYAGERFQRLCNEQGIPFEFVGNITDTPAMGPQPDDTLLNVLQQVEDLDQGLLFEPLDQFGLGYRTYVSLTNQAPAVVADYSQGQLSQVLVPTEDDQLTRNYVTVTRSYIPVSKSSQASPVRGIGKFYPALAKIVAGIGSSYTAMQTTGPLSTQDPPNGVGQYTYSITINCENDSQLVAVANIILALGTVDDYRYPTITFDLTRTESIPIFGALTALRIGDHLQVVNPPSFLTPNTIDQLAYGFTLDISAFQYQMALNCVPESPYEVGG